ncbi:hypothetical protein [Haloarchaeobius sp. HRN-SO-5]|uniref:hypothetical protein n=1 Tax=Haloarchaeobius sp. HRN-SO-5 TaxID=3446118 RepID=UPI003EBDC7F5
MHRTCPDCNTTMDAVEFGMNDAWNPHVRTGEKRDGLLGTLGVDEQTPVETFMCQNCGLVRQYADVEE